MTIQTNDSNKKGYVYGFVKPTSPDFAKYPPLVGPTLKPYGGRMLAKQPISEAVYTENAEDYKAAFVLEFPSLQKALDWYYSKEYSQPKQLRLSTSTGPFLIVEAEDFGIYKGFLTAFIDIQDGDKFSKYSPVESLAKYNVKRAYTTMGEAALTEETNNYDSAVVIAFSTIEDAKEWMESNEYQPERELRLSTTTGPCAIFGTK